MIDNKKSDNKYQLTGSNFSSMIKFRSNINQPKNVCIPRKDFNYNIVTNKQKPRLGIES